MQKIFEAIKGSELFRPVSDKEATDREEAVFSKLYKADVELAKALKTLGKGLIQKPTVEIVVDGEVTSGTVGWRHAVLRLGDDLFMPFHTDSDGSRNGNVNKFLPTLELGKPAVLSFVECFGYPRSLFAGIGDARNKNYVDYAQDRYVEAA